MAADGPGGAAAPRWLADWRDRGVPPAEALARFDRLGPVAPEAMLGGWRGTELPTGHPLDGLLGAFGWWGKRFESIERVHPLVFHCGAARVPLEPSLAPLGLALRLGPHLPRGAVPRWAFRRAMPLAAARQAGARLERRTYRGTASATMVYRRLPVVDHFRAAGHGRVIGLMEAAGMTRPFFFLLERDDAG